MTAFAAASPLDLMPDPATVAVCFTCRKRVVERESGSGGTCPDCGVPVARLSSRLPLPPRDNVRGWDALREVCDVD